MDNNKPKVPETPISELQDKYPYLGNPNPHIGGPESRLAFDMPVTVIDKTQPDNLELYKVKNIICKAFQNNDFVFCDSIPMDAEIAEFIFEVNKLPHIMTTNSCAGHDKFESNARYDFVSHPYLAFLVDSVGWDIFWGCILPKMCLKVLVHCEIVNEPGKISIVIRCHYDDKKLFWETLSTLFLNDLKLT